MSIPVILSVRPERRQHYFLRPPSQSHHENLRMSVLDVPPPLVLTIGRSSIDAQPERHGYSRSVRDGAALVRRVHIALGHALGDFPG